MAHKTLWWASPADTFHWVTVWRFSPDGRELNHWSIQVPQAKRDADLGETARLARAWWLLLAGHQLAVGVSLNRSQLLRAPAQGQPGVVTWSCPREERRLRRSIAEGAQPRLPDGHLRGAPLPGGQLLLLPAVTGMDEQGVVTQADRLLGANPDGTVSRSLPLPRPAAAPVRDPADPLIL